MANRIALEGTALGILAPHAELVRAEFAGRALFVVGSRKRRDVSSHRAGEFDRQMTQPTDVDDANVRSGMLDVRT